VYVLLHIIFVVQYIDTPKVEFDPGCEAMIYTTDGTPLQGAVSFQSLYKDLG
jgi:hypothetical protein